jgi:hypothetical protein
MTEPTDIKSEAAGLAALSICESLLLALNDLKIMKANELVGVLEDAAAVHRGAGSATTSAELHKEVVVVIDRIIAAGNSSFRP